MPGESFQSLVVGVTRPVVSVSDVRRTDARSRKRDTPEGVIQGFHVSVYKVDPRIDVLACNLLSKHSCRSELLDEPVPRRPQVPLVSKPSAFACRAERLAWAGSGPHWEIVGPACELQCVCPSADAGEEMTLGVSVEFIRFNILDRTIVDITRRHNTVSDQLLQDRDGLRIVFVVVIHHQRQTAFFMRVVMPFSISGLLP
jgi:hypothetical protein